MRLDPLVHQHVIDCLEQKLGAPENWECVANAIQDDVRAHAPHLQTGDLKRLHVSDLEILFQAIDRQVFEGWIGHILKKIGAPLSFRLGTRMTSCGGTTTRIRSQTKSSQERYEIAIAPRLLFTTFQLAPSALVCGIECFNVYEALQRIMEHESIHLLEMVVWRVSSCKRRRFKDIAHRCFGHSSSNHCLMTPAQAAANVFEIRVGDQVAFEFEGHSLRGVVNRVTRRATVLVRSAAGQRYTDGLRYRKFYVPMEALRKID
ncbi:MAG TPA: hypothetical protein PKD54_07260 [Pirellulaceae bacterium]|nr:hypothetical protein [Pirellulaceae bacterium]